MKNLILLLAFTLSSVIATSQDIKENLAESFKSGNSKAIASNFTSSVDLAVKDKDDVYSKAQAEQILKKFFSDHKPSSFKIMHEGESRNGIKYYIGQLETSNGSFRVTIHLKNEGGKSKIHQLRIE